MLRLFTEDVTIELLPELGCILPAGILISGRLDDAQSVLEIAVEEGIPARAIGLFAMDGASVGVVSLEAKATAFGSIRYGELALESLPQMILIRPLEGSQNILLSYSFAIDLKSGTGFSAPFFTGSMGGSEGQDMSLLSFGPRGRDRCPGIVNVLTITTTPKGVKIDLILDDRGALMGVEALAMAHLTNPVPADTLVRARSVPLLKRPKSPGRVQLLLPIGVVKARMRFHSHDQKIIESLTCDLNFVTMRLGPEEVVENTCDGCAMLAEAAPALSEGDHVDSGTDSSLELVRSEREARKLDLVQEFQSFARDSDSRAFVPKNWPDTLGSEGTAIGPPGWLTGSPALRIVGRPAQEGRRRCDILFDDAGYIQKVIVGIDAATQMTRTVDRVTSISIGVCRIDLPDHAAGGFIFSMDRFGRAVPNLSSGVDFTSASFTVREPDVGVWAASVRFGDPVDHSTSRCAVCAIPVSADSARALWEMDPELRQMVRTRHEPAPGIHSVCQRCLSELEGQRPSREGLRRLVSLAALGRFGVRICMIVCGGLLPLTLPGSLLVSYLGSGGLDVLYEVEATFVVSLVGAILVGSLPQALILDPLLSTIDNRRRHGRSGPRSRLMPLGVFLVLVSALYATGVGLRPSLVAPFFQEVLPTACLVAMILVTVMLEIGSAAVQFSRHDEMIESARNKRIGDICESVSQMMRSQGEEEFYRLLHLFLNEGLGSTVYQIYEFDQGSRDYRVREFKCPSGYEFAMTRFVPGHANLASLAAELAVPLSALTLEAETGISGDDLENGSVKVAFPLEFNGQVQLVVSIEYFREASTYIPVTTLLSTLGKSMSTAFENATRDRPSLGSGVHGFERPSFESLVATFGTYFPREFIRRAEEEPSLLSLEGEETEVTLLVIDFPGLRRVSDGWSASDRVRFISRIYSELAPVVVRFGGFVERFEECGFVSFFGRPRSLRDPALSASRAAHEVHGRLLEILPELTPQVQGPLVMRSAVATGGIILGNAGSRECFNYMAMGPTVDRARLLTILGDYYDVDVIADGHTSELVEGSFLTRPIDQIFVPGGRESLSLIELMAAVDSEPARQHRAFAETYQNALIAYLEGRFGQATTLFEQALSLRANDKPSLILRERCQEFSRSPPKHFNGCVLLDHPGVFLRG